MHCEWVDRDGMGRDARFEDIAKDTRSLLVPRGATRLHVWHPVDGHQAAKGVRAKAEKEHHEGDGQRTSGSGRVYAVRLRPEKYVVNDGQAAWGVSYLATISPSRLNSTIQLIRAVRSRKLFITTLMELNAIAALARTGFSMRPMTGYKAPAAIGMPSTL